MLRQTLIVIHAMTAVLMAWPYYALIITGERIKLGPPLDRADEYLENIIRQQTVRCFVFQCVLLASGAAMVYLTAGPDWLRLLLAGGNLRLLGKVLLVLLLMAMTIFMHFYLQPRIDGLLASSRAAPSQEIARQLGRLRLLRRLMAAMCLWYVLIAVLLGVQVWESFGPVFIVAAAIIAALFVWRVYKGLAPFGWV